MIKKILIQYNLTDKKFDPMEKDLEELIAHKEAEAVEIYKFNEQLDRDNAEVARRLEVKHESDDAEIHFT